MPRRRWLGVTYTPQGAPCAKTCEVDRDRDPLPRRVVVETHHDNEFRRYAEAALEVPRQTKSGRHWATRQMQEASQAMLRAGAFRMRQRPVS
jgi:hypothetical protein